MQIPQATKKPQISMLHGIKRYDNYSWLRDPNWQNVLKDPRLLASDIRAYLEAENTYADTVMAPTKPLENALYQEMYKRIAIDDMTPPDQDGKFAYYLRQRQDTQYPVFCRCPTPHAHFSPNAPLKGEEVLLDSNKEADGLNYFDIGTCVHSPNHRYLAYCIDVNGAEFYTLYIRDLVNQRLIGKCIQRVQPDIVWTNDSSGLVYVALDNYHRPEYVALHRLNQTDDEDHVIYREPDPHFFISLDKTRLKKFIIIDMHDHVTSETRLLNADNGIGETRLISKREANIEYAVEERNGIFLIMTNANGVEDYKLVTTSIDSPERKSWRDFIVPRKGVLLESFLVARNFLIRTEREEGLPRIIVSTFGKNNQITDEHSIEFEEEVYELDTTNTFDAESDILRFTYTSMSTPARVIDYDMRTRTHSLQKEKYVPDHKPENYITRRLHAPTADGDTVPLSLLHAKDTPLDGSATVLLYGYGAYGHSTPAVFSANRLSLVNRGFIYAIAHVRGGMEKGYAWYRNGKFEKKKNTFSDFIASAKYLINENFTRAGNIAIHGGSAGGMLIGNVLNEYPELFGVAVADVPFVDVLNTMCDEDLPLTPPEWQEWGNPIKDKLTYHVIAEYSPYDNVKIQAYPPILVTTSLSDPRVTYWEPAKWTAKLRALKTDKNHLLLKTNLSAGHGGASGRFDYLKEVAFMYTFILMNLNTTSIKKLASLNTSR